MVRWLRVGDATVVFSSCYLAVVLQIEVSNHSSGSPWHCLSRKTCTVRDSLLQRNLSILSENQSPCCGIEAVSASTDQWLELDFGKPTTVNEFRIREDASSSIIRYAIELWSDKRSRWVGCFNGRAIGRDFIAPIVSRTSRKARLFIMRTTKGNPGIIEFEAYNDTTTGRPKRRKSPPDQREGADS